MDTQNNLNNLLKFNYLVKTSFTIIFGKVFTKICYSFIDNIILPIIYIDFNKNNKSDINYLKNKTFNIFGIKFKFGVFFIDSIKFLFTILILYILNKMN